ncbi:unnamed protein product [Orchesella dallaii]|uniref:Gustatory receptor n=1 Tax=Orchesella dallaii TaxID=48710 RepID=A0ABP1R2H2_9HEXA
MKQKLFLVKPTLQSKLSSMSPNFIHAPPETPPPPYPRVNIVKLLRDLANITVWPSQRSGLFIFTLDKANTRFTFSWLSIPTLMAFLRLLVILGVAAYINWNENLVHQRFGVHSGENSTLGVTEMILSTTMFCSDFIGIVLFWKDRKRIGIYLNLYEENLANFVEDLKDHSWIPGWFEKARRTATWLVRGIDVVTHICIFVLIKPELLKIVMHIRGKNEMGKGLDWEAWSFPIFSLFWFTILFRRLFFRVLIMSMIDSLHFGFRALKEHVKEFAHDKSIASEAFGDVRMRSLRGDEFRLGTGGEKEKAKVEITVTDYVKEVTLDRILEKYRAMETMLGEFNELFASHLLIGIVSMVVVLLMALFHFFVEVNYTMSWNAPIFAIEALAYSWVLFSLGTSATEMASEADACITALRDVPLGSINPGLKQKVAGTLTTYLIVLIQFQTSESPSKAGSNSSEQLESKSNG